VFIEAKDDGGGGATGLLEL